MDPLLAQIKDLLTQYLAQGQDTPVAAEAQALSDAIDQAGDPTSTGAGDLPPAPDEALASALQGQGGDQGGGNPMESMMPSSPPSSFRDASEMAAEDMKKRKKSSY